MDLQLPVQSVLITTKVVSLNSIHGLVYSIQLNVIKFVSDLWQVGGFLWVSWFTPPIRLTSAFILFFCTPQKKKMQQFNLPLLGIHCRHLLTFTFYKCSCYCFKYMIGPKGTNFQNFNIFYFQYYFNALKV